MEMQSRLQQQEAKRMLKVIAIYDDKEDLKTLKDIVKTGGNVWTVYDDKLQQIKEDKDDEGNATGTFNAYPLEVKDLDTFVAFFRAYQEGGQVATAEIKPLQEESKDDTEVAEQDVAADIHDESKGSSDAKADDITYLTDYFDRQFKEYTIRLDTVERRVSSIKNIFNPDILLSDA